MIFIETENGLKNLTGRTKAKVVTEKSGHKTMTFDLPTRSELYIKYVKEEVRLKYQDNFFLIKKLNQRSKLSTITAELDMDDWKRNMHQHFRSSSKTFADVILEIIPDGWRIGNTESIAGRRTLDLEGVSDYDILLHCMKTYDFVLEYHIANKLLNVIKPQDIQARGLYASEELNLSQLEYKGDSTSYINVLYGFGKRTEERDEAGNVTSINYVTFSSINGGKPYVENFSYKEKRVVGYWQDNRYEDPQELLNDTIDRLKTLAEPIGSYSCSLIDLSRNEKYRFLDFKLHDKVTLIFGKRRVQHQIVQYIEYPDNKKNNTVLLSNEFKRIDGTIDDIKQSVSDIDIETKRNEISINKIIRDVESNTLAIQNTYTKGEIDELEKSIIQQTSKNIELSVKEISEVVQEIEKRIYVVKMIQQYGISSDKEIVPAEWQEERPEVPEGLFLWTRTKFIYSDETVEYGEAQLLTSQQGADGKGINEVLQYWAISDTTVDAPTSGWQLEKPAKSSSQFYWSYFQIVYTDETSKSLDPFCVTGETGKDAAIHSDTAPTDKTQLWLDTSSTPHLLKQWDGEDWKLVNDFTDDIEQTRTEITESYTALINESARQIELFVQKLQEITDGQATSIIALQNQLQLTTEMAQFVKTTTETLQDLVDGKVSITEIIEWARFDGASLELGASNSPFKCIVNPTELAFYQGKTRIAWLSNNELHVRSIRAEEAIYINDYGWVDEGEDGLSLL